MPAEFAPPPNLTFRVLSILQVLSARFRTNLNDIADAAHLPPPTVHRILASMIESGFVVADGRAGEYRLSCELHRLALGIDPRIMVLDAVRGPAEQLTRELGWPVGIGFLERGAMVVDFSTRKLTTQKFLPSTLGERLQLDVSALGQAALAALPRDQLVAILDRMPACRADPTFRAEIVASAEAARERGYGLRSRGRPGVSSVAVSLDLGGPTIGAIVMTFFTKTVGQAAIPALVSRLIQVRDEAKRRFTR